jgi:small multidrug resistance family-3 protein
MMLLFAANYINSTSATNAIISTNTSSSSSSTTTTDKLDDVFQWTAITIVQATALFCFAGVAEIIGGWLVWGALRKDKPRYYALLGSALLVAYGFIPCLQPTDSFGRIYAAYGGFFIVLSFLIGWGLDGDKPDIGDVAGGAIAIVGVCLIMFWPRG